MRGSIILWVKHPILPAATVRVSNYFKALISVSKRDSELVKPLKSAASGTLAYISTMAISYPLDLIHSCLQVDAGIPLAVGTATVVTYRYTGVLDAVQKVWARSGLPGFYQGALLSIVGTFIYRATYYASYATIQRKANEYSDSLFEDEAERSLHKMSRKPLFKFTTSLFCSVTACFVAYPLETLRRRAQIADASLFANDFSFARDIILNEGVDALYRGCPAFLVTSVLTSCFFAGLNYITSTAKL